MAATPPAQGNVRRRFLILHGWQNRRPQGHWERILATELAARGHDVTYPQLPEPDRPALKDWVEVIDAELQHQPPREQVVIAHSLACVAWIHLAQLGSVRLPVDRLLFVAPPSPKYLAETPELREFQFTEGAHQAVVATSKRPPRLVYAENDPYCSPAADILYDDAFDLDCVPRAGHFDLIAGYGRWASVLRWCENEAERLTAR